MGIVLGIISDLEMLEKTLEGPLDSKEIKPVHPKGNQPWIFIGRTDAEAETPILWPPDEKNYSLEKTLMLGRIEGRRRRGWQRMRWLDDIIGRLDGPEFEWPPRAGNGQGGLTCFSPWGHRESDMTERLNWTERWFKYSRECNIGYIQMLLILYKSGDFVHLGILVPARGPWNQCPRDPEEWLYF